jgi:CheY-like chemotaxis protein
MIKPGPIIFIDDDRDDCEILQDALSELKISNELICFTNGEDALAYLRVTTDKPFLILCDINMPVMSGIQLRKQIHEDDYLRAKSIPFIFYTTSATDQAIRDAYKMSVQGFFVKEHDPVKIRELVDCLVQYWQKCRHPNQ